MSENFELIDSVNIKHNVNKINKSVNSVDFLNILCLNTRSLRNKFNDVRHLITSYDFDIHIIVLSEIFIYSN